MLHHGTAFTKRQNNLKMGQVYNYRIEASDGVTTNFTTRKGSKTAYCSGTTKYCNDPIPCEICDGIGKCDGSSYMIKTTGSGTYYIHCKLATNCSIIGSLNNAMVFSDVHALCECGYCYGLERSNICSPCYKAAHPAKRHTCANCEGKRRDTMRAFQCTKTLLL